MPSAIDPTQIPGKDIDPETIETQAATVGTIAGSVRDNGSDVHLKWQGMAGVYSAPESGTLLGLMQPVSSQATAVGDNLDVVSAALTQFAADVRPIKAELDALRSQAEQFQAEIAGGVQVRELNPAWVTSQSPYGGTSTISYSSPSIGGNSTAPADIPQYRTVTKEWHEDQDYVDRNNDLIAAVNAQQVALWEAERACANKIRALYGAADLRAAQSEDDSLGYGLSEIPEGTEMPWGAPVERSEGCAEATVTFVVEDFLWEGIAVGGVWGTVQGLGTLILGYNPATGDWFSGDAYGAAWGNLGMLGVAALTNTGVLAPIFQADAALRATGADGFLPQEVRDFKADADEAALNTGKALIAWDKWEDDPGTALGESVFNVGTALIPVGGAAVAGVKTASTAASVLTKMTRVVEFVDPAAWAVNGTVRLGGMGLGSLDTMIGKVDGFDTPNIEVYTAMDSASALHRLDQWDVDLDTVTARVDDGIPVLEFPGGRVELPAGAFDNAAGGVKIGDGAAVVSPVREPELVAAGGVRGETGPSVTNSLVDEAPVRTETGGSGESTVVRESDTGGTTADGSGANHAGDDAGAGANDGGADDGGADDGSGALDDGAGADEGPASAGSAADPTDPTVWRSPEDPNLTLTESQKGLLDDALTQAHTIEPRITGSLLDVAAQHAGVRMEGLENAVKSDDSFARKFAQKLQEVESRDGVLTSNGVQDAMFASSRDTVRYTYIVPEGSYTPTVQSIVDDLSGQGYRLSEFKNSWGDEGYQGINSVWVDATGQKFEVQFHTDQSFTAKTAAHEYYESDRLGNATPEAAEASAAAQAEIFDRVPRPHGADSLSVLDEYVQVLDKPGEPTSRIVLDADVADTLAQSFHNFDADSVMLGKFGDGGPTSYIGRAGDTHTYFDLGQRWNDIRVQQGLSNDDMFTLYNAAFLDDAILKGKTIEFSHDPVNDPGYLGMELEYLKKHGYRYDADTNTAYPPLD
jgi:hypothetical protein